MLFSSLALVLQPHPGRKVINYNRNNAIHSTICKRVSLLPLHLYIASLPIILLCCVLQEIILAIVMIQEYQLMGLD